MQGLLTGVQFMATHPGTTGKALVDWDTWMSDPARAAGRLVPDLLLTIATAGAGGAVRASSATRRLDKAADAVRRLDGHAFPSLDKQSARELVERLGFDPDAPSGRAARWQVDAPYGALDRWQDVTLQAGDRVAIGVPGVSGFGVPVDAGVEQITAIGARDWFEGLQVAPKRVLVDGDTVPQPTMRAEVAVFEIRGDVSAARSVTEANPQFGTGGRDQVYIPDMVDLMESGDVVEVQRLRFDEATLGARVEDPQFLAVDPSLPARPLDPGLENLVGRAQGLAVGGALAGLSGGLGVEAR